LCLVNADVVAMVGHTILRAAVTGPPVRGCVISSFCKYTTQHILRLGVHVSRGGWQRTVQGWRLAYSAAEVLVVRIARDSPNSAVFLAIPLQDLADALGNPLFHFHALPFDFGLGSHGTRSRRASRPALFPKRFNHHRVGRRDRQLIWQRVEPLGLLDDGGLWWLPPHIGSVLRVVIIIPLAGVDNVRGMEGCSDGCRVETPETGDVSRDREYCCDTPQSVKEGT
jgi:hypothetical protein